MTTTSSDRMEWYQVASLIIAFLALCVAMPLGLSQPDGSGLRIACGVVSAVSLTWVVAFLWFAPKN